MLRVLFSGALVAALAVTFAALDPAAAADNERFKKVLDRGVVVVGVKADYKPWGFRVKIDTLPLPPEFSVIADL